MWLIMFQPTSSHTLLNLICFIFFFFILPYQYKILGRLDSERHYDEIDVDYHSLAENASCIQW